MYCIFGMPVRHSFSPVIHNAAFNQLGINAVYLAFEPPSIEDAIQSMRTLNILGASVTIPFKIDVIKHIDGIDQLAARIGSVNTLVNWDGKITGFNTDGYGAIRALENENIPLGNATCLVIGNGGSARAIAFTLLARGASIIIAGRNVTRIEGLAAELRKTEPSVRAVPLSDIDRKLMETVDIIINTTPVGMSPDINAVPIDPGFISARHTVFDIVYSPHMTKLLSAAEERGSTIVHGIEMLVHQGARQFELWTGTSAPVETMRRAVLKHLQIGP
ncbi:MAG: shikimate dehydrogenase [Spirochaetes bacterium RBG_13_51_14]|nr:MAG: shikimate dehydrogenase [Spirochaetes bacterium RBG_13_51_14]